MISLIDIIIQLGGVLVEQATKAKWPEELIAAIQAAVDKFAAVKNDPVTKAQLESLRG